MSCIEPSDQLTFVRAVYQSRELGGALQRYATAATLYNVKHRLDGGLPTDRNSQSVVSSGEALVAKLVLKDLDTPQHHFTCPPTEEGLEVVQHLQRAVFGADGPQQSLAHCVYLATLAQAAQALELVTATLLDVVSPLNCLSLFNVAAACGCVPLRRRAHALALSCFTQASQHDLNGLLEMEEAHLMRLLCSDSLKVASEVEVLQALAVWTEYAPTARKPQFAARFARCVRLGNVSMAELYLLDAHPLVVSDRHATMLVAQVYMHLVMGVALEYPLGLRTISHRRHCQQAAAAAPAADPAVEQAQQQQQQQAPAAPQGVSGLPAHAGQHGSALEAVVCAYGRHQQAQLQPQGADADAAEAGMRRLSVSATQPQAPSSAAAAAAGLAPQSPAFMLTQVPTPTAAAHAAAPLAQQQSRVRHLGIGKRVGSRRTLFGMAGSSKGEQFGSKLAAADTAPAVAQAAGMGGQSPRGDASTQVLVGGVTLEMHMSPNRASISSMAAAAAAAAFGEVSMDSRKRLRFF
ncbi:hypothetical protein D9Q98_007981 [Chlorella vulgaris]|uniref:BACK domain-containing protein n=1 Tax=Chlorella vulgaris TaxID=3077 RepID=A0A9D4YTP3_CHLVU|nr:hypothetical protein D9Q98_007981 [Chlorella vulgaris]